MKLSVEMSQTVPTSKYGVIHRTGCRDLRDDMPLGEASTKSEAAELAEDWLNWDYEPSEWEYAACVKLPK